MKNNSEFRKIATDKLTFKVFIAARKAFLRLYNPINQTLTGTYFSNRFKNS